MESQESPELQHTPAKGPEDAFPSIGPDHLKFQIALDELGAGSSESMKTILAQSSGIDPSTVKLVSKPWTLEEDSNLDFLGQIDSLQPKNLVNSVFESGPSKTVRHVDFQHNNLSEQYQYECLSEPSRQIRLLRLGSCQSKKCMDCHPPGLKHFDHLQVMTFDLEAAPEYYCLSYVWGAPETSISVNCDGKTQPVTQNLFHALATTFNRYPECYLWADGICINQANHEERSAQVLLMGKIYSRCQMTVAHPGHFRYGLNEEVPAKPDDERACALSELVLDMDEVDPGLVDSCQAGHQSSGLAARPLASTKGDEHEVLFDTSQTRTALSLMNLLTRTWSLVRFDRPHEAVPDEHWAELDLPGDEAVWANLFHLWRQDWMFRAWVLPECILSDKVVIMYGDHIVSLDFIMDFWNAASRHGLPNVLRHGFWADVFGRLMSVNTAMTISKLREQRSKTTKVVDRSLTPVMIEPNAIVKNRELLELLASTRNMASTDPRDKVYSLLGLTNHSISKSMKPDYADSNTASDTFLQVAKAQIQAGLVMDLLEHSGLDQRVEGLPSWVPDWTHQSRSRLRTDLYCANDAVTSSPAASISQDDKELRLRGKIVSSIETVTPAWRFFTRPSNLSEPAFLPMRTANGETITLPPFSDEDGRCFILQIALATVDGMESCSDLYDSENQNLQDIVARTLCADRSWSGERLSRVPAALEDFLDSFAAFRQFYAEGPPEESDWRSREEYANVRVHQPGHNIFMWLLRGSEEESEQLMAKLWPFAMAMQETMRGRRFGMLTSGHMAILPWNAERDDAVILLEGGRVPFVMRSASPKGWKLVGDCYVHGLMDGKYEEENLTSKQEEVIVV